MKSTNKWLSMLLIVVLVFSIAGCKKADEEATTTTSDGQQIKEETFGFWLGRAEDSTYYSDYSQNPILKQYLANTYTGQDGDQVKINFEFQVPPTGSESDNFNTLLATGDYMDIMDKTFFSGSLMDLYNDGLVLDLTEYVDKYMPNYKAFLADNPDLAISATNLVNGEQKYLQLYSYNTSPLEWQGFLYRRDWVVKYGKNPETGESFSGAYTVKNDDGTWNTDSWEDNVVFPSGGSDPVYISDFEWMFKIFDIALADLGITDGYSTSIYYQGFDGLGFFNSSFGGGSPTFYKQKDGTIAFGGSSDEMRAYLECMNTWYNNGWLDKAFVEHTNTMPWRIDEAKVRQGKVGLWHGIDSQLFNRMNNGDELTKDIIAYATAFPINDIYGEPEQQNKEPYSVYQVGAEGKYFVVTDKAKDKDLGALFTLFDSMYAPENSVLNAYGFSKEEYTANQDPFYTDFGLTEGAYSDSGTQDSRGREVYFKNTVLTEDTGSLLTAATMGRMLGLLGDSPTRIVIDGTLTEQYRKMKSIWYDTYKNTGLLPLSFTSQMNTEQAKEYAAINTNVTEFMSVNIPTFIIGAKDIYNDDDWNAFKKALNKYNPERGREIFQEVLDSISK